LVLPFSAGEFFSSPPRPERFWGCTYISPLTSLCVSRHI